MCGICGVVSLDYSTQSREELFNIILRMIGKLDHRGPDGVGIYQGDYVNFGFTRLAIVDLEGGMQPLYNEDRSIVLVCNGEIFNYKELRKDLVQRGHVFSTKCDVEVIIHLYEEYKEAFIDKLNGQFAFVIYDIVNETVICARDRFGICPLYYTIQDNHLIFASEIKAILEYPGITRSIDLVGLDQILTFPGLISPRTMFSGIQSLESGHYLFFNRNSKGKIQYWDLIYPAEVQLPTISSEDHLTEILYEMMKQSVSLRSRADVPIGFYASGGLDSSLIASLYKKLHPNTKLDTFSINIQDKQFTEEKYQRMISEYLGSCHRDIHFSSDDVARLLEKSIYFSECPIKETYNTASLALSKMVNEKQYKVVMSGEGSDELFAGYVSYKFDQMRAINKKVSTYQKEDLEINNRIWGEPDFFYETPYSSLIDTKKMIYAQDLPYAEIDCLKHPIINKDRIKGLHPIHKRSYIDFKLRLVDHLVSDHGDRMGLANSVEIRFPFLDNDVVDFVRHVPPSMMLREYKEKYLLNQMAKTKGLLPDGILNREKFAFVAPGSPALLRGNHPWVLELLSSDTIKRQGVFNASYVESLVNKYRSDQFAMMPHYDLDLLTVVLTTTIFMDTFRLTV